MNLEYLIKGLQTKDVIGNLQTEITGVNIDSRRIEEGHLFIAVKGTQVDGHTYINKAIEKGAERSFST